MPDFVPVKPARCRRAGPRRSRVYVARSCGADRRRPDRERAARDHPDRRGDAELEFPPHPRRDRKASPGGAGACSRASTRARPLPADYVEHLRALGITYFPSSERAVRALARIPLARRGAALRPSLHHQGPGVREALRSDPEWRRPAGVDRRPVSQRRLATTLTDAKAITARIGYPVVLKAQAAALPQERRGRGDGSAWTTRPRWREWDQAAATSRRRPGLRSMACWSRRWPPRRGTDPRRPQRPGWGPVVLVGFGGVRRRFCTTAPAGPGPGRGWILAKSAGSGRGPARRLSRRRALDVDAVAGIAGHWACLWSATRGAADRFTRSSSIRMGEGALALDLVSTSGRTPPCTPLRQLALDRVEVCVALLHVRRRSTASTQSASPSRLCSRLVEGSEVDACGGAPPDLRPRRHETPSGSLTVTQTSTLLQAVSWPSGPAHASPGSRSLS